MVEMLPSGTALYCVYWRPCKHVGYTREDMSLNAVYILVLVYLIKDNVYLYIEFLL